MPGINYFISLTTNFLRFDFERSKNWRKMLSDVGRSRDTRGMRQKMSLPGASADMEPVLQGVRHSCLMSPSIQTHETVIIILTPLTVCHLVISFSS
jgi:hypothetical protein